MQCSHSIYIVKWEDEALKLRSIRTIVFIQEQQIPANLEWDEFDAISMHVLALNSDGQPIGTARVLPDGHIGRLSVLKAWRGKGIGSAIMLKIIEELTNQEIPKVMLNSQVSAISFYERFGFRISGKEFMEAGIAHVKMILRL